MYEVKVFMPTQVFTVLAFYPQQRIAYFMSQGAIAALCLPKKIR